MPSKQARPEYLNLGVDPTHHRRIFRHRAIHGLPVGKWIIVRVRRLPDIRVLKRVRVGLVQKAKGGEEILILNGVDGGEVIRPSTKVLPNIIPSKFRETNRAVTPYTMPFEADNVLSA